MKFTRFGVLSPQKQVTYGKEGFHSAPTKKGFYAFPYPYVEKFLLGATSDPRNSSYKSYWLKDDDGKYILFSDVYSGYDYEKDKYIFKPEFKKLLKKRKIKEVDISSIYLDEKHNVDNSVVTVLKKPHIFEYSGMVWHHLYNTLKMSPMSGEWVKTDIETYKKALDLERHHNKTTYLRRAHEEGWLSDDDSWIRGKDGLELYTKDYLEIFIEKIK